MSGPRRVILIDPNETSREGLARRLTGLGYVVDTAPDATVGGELALFSPPAAVIADLWMPGISGIQLCRLLRAEPATSEVSIILRGEEDTPKSRFWAERAGAVAFVPKRRMGQLVGALTACMARAPEADGFFMQLGQGGGDLRDRIAQHLDAALSELVVASEIKGLSNSPSFDHLFDRLSQFSSQVLSYRWLALHTATPHRLAVHHPPGIADAIEAEVRAALPGAAGAHRLRIEDEDAAGVEGDGAPTVVDIAFDGQPLGRLAISPIPGAEADVRALALIVGRELGAPLRMADLLAESQMLARVDGLTGLLNRRALSAAFEGEVARSRRYGHPLAALMIDVDRFKLFNDTYGHATGDQVLRSVAETIKETVRESDLAGRWGGEEFVVALTSTSFEGARTAAERLRAAIERIALEGPNGEVLRVTASIGLSDLRANEGIEACLERADKALYRAKASGRNRVEVGRSAPPAALSEVA